MILNFLVLRSPIWLSRWFICTLFLPQS